MDFNILTVSALPPECNDITDSEKFRKYVKSDFAFRSNVVINCKGDKVSYSLFGKEKIINIRPKSATSQNGSSTVTGKEEKHTQDDNPPPDNPKENNSLIPAVINFNCSSVKLLFPQVRLI